MTTTLTLAHPENTIHEATAAAIIRVIEAHDIEPEVTIGPKDILGQMLSDGEIDLYISVWLPGADDALITNGVTQLGNLFQPGTRCYLPESNSGFASLNELTEKEIPFSRTIIVQDSLRQQAEKIITAYNLNEVGFTLQSMPDDQALSALADALDNNTASLMILTDPCFLLHQASLSSLDEPKNVLPQNKAAHMLLRPGLAEEMDIDLRDELDELMLSTKIISAMDYAMRTEGLSADEAAEAWQRGKLIPR